MNKEACKIILLVLLVEDNANDADMICHDLNVALPNVKVDAVPSAEKAREYLQNNKPDLVLLDISLAGSMSGLDYIKEVRSMIECPIIIVTGDDRITTAQEAIRSGADSYLVKGNHSPELMRWTIAMAVARRETYVMEPREKLAQKLKSDHQRIDEDLRATDQHVQQMRANIYRIKQVIGLTANGCEST